MMPNSRAPLEKADIERELTGLPGWSFDGERLVRTFELADFRAAFRFMMGIAFCAEAMDHHPELRNVYNRVEVVLTTHSAGNRVTAFDIRLAREIEALGRS